MTVQHNHYDYSGDNDLTRQYVTDGSGAVTEQYSYQYDSLGRLIHSRQSTGGGTLVQLTQHMYDNANRLTSQSWQFGGDTFRQSYTYTGQNGDGKQVDGTISAVTTTLPDGQTITASYKYTVLRQLWQRRTSLDGKEQFLRNYAYAVIAEDDGCNRIGTRIAYAAYRTPDGKLLFGYQYTYDTAGNISGVTTMPSERDNITQAYTYDALGQLTTETTGASTRTYAYDTAGNIRSITKDGTVTKSFGYTNASWPDLLTNVTANGTTKDVLYEGQSQTSDLPSSGNPVTYYNGKDYSFTWTKGRQLASATVDGQTVKYAYDMSGVRSGKQVGDTTYTYTTLSGKVMRQQWDGKTLEFVYDDSSQPFAMIYKHGSETELYYYFVSAQGDVSAILDSGGKIAASYDYDAWGNCTVYDSSDAAIGDLNPLRYRGYYYDAETGFYYLQSRYYDPAICRFINADTFATTDANGVLSANMFAYCENNPVMRTDPDGSSPLSLVINTLVGAGVSVASAAINANIAGSPISTGDLIKAAAVGAVSGFLSSVSPVQDMTAAFGATVSAVVTFAGAMNSGSSIGEAALSSVVAATSTYVSSKLGASAFGSAVGKSVDVGKGIIGLYTSASMEGLASSGRAARQIYQSTRRKRARQRITNHRSLFSRYRNRFSRSKSSWAR